MNEFFVIVAAAWYFAAIVVLWSVTLRLRHHAQLEKCAPWLFLVVTMLVTASAFYYGYLDAPIYERMRLVIAILLPLIVYNTCVVGTARMSPNVHVYT